jgi:peptidoglycan/LPS O-acetylase OafA/YrhL
LIGILSRTAQWAHLYLLGYLFAAIQQVMKLGGYGVAVFFVISGFCIHLSRRQSTSGGWSAFYIRRIFRIYPAYLVSLLIFVAILPNTRWPADWAASAGHQVDLILHLLLIHNALPETIASINGVYWSLAIEFQLYLLFPLLLLIVRRIGWGRAIMVTAVVEAVTRVYLILVVPGQGNLYPTDWWAWIDLSPLGFWFSWSIGAWIADRFLDHQPLPFAQGPFPLWAWPLIVFAFHYTPYLHDFAFPAAAIGSCRYLAHFLSRHESNVPEAEGVVSRTFIFLGTISYSLYLLHEPLIQYIMSFKPAAHGSVAVYPLEIAVILGSIAATVAASGALYLFVEKPGIALGKKVIRSLLNPGQRAA